jgi:hypothetical protein|tara:strand:+ start:1960 stop:3072 length:1113 start_codon:yes stop_codon:yes gene_type:complete
MFRQFLDRFRDKPPSGYVPDPREDDERNLQYAPMVAGGEIRLPINVDKFPKVVYNQGRTTSCTTQSTCGVILNVRNKHLSPRYAFYRIKTDKKYGSSRLGWGAYELDSLVLQVKEGICEYTLAPNERTRSDAEFLALKVDQEMKESANKNRGGAYVQVASRHDDALSAFDKIVQYLGTEGRPVKMTLKWYSEYNGVKGGVIPIRPPKGRWFGHSMQVVQVKMIKGHEYLGCKNSYGPYSGDKGIEWLPKGFTEITGSFAYLPPERAVQLEVAPPRWSVTKDERNKHRERANAQELEKWSKRLWFPLDVPEKPREANVKGLAIIAREKLKIINALVYLGWTMKDVGNHVYARSRGRTKTKAYNLDLTRKKE